MVRDRIRSGVRRVGQGIARRVFGAPERPVASAPASAPAARPSPLAPLPAPAPAPAAAAAPVASEPSAEPEAPSGPAMTMESVLAVIDDLIRPALQSDGGDIDLVAVDGPDVHVRLIGACRTCPSSTITMKMGIERLLAEEFPQFRNLVQVDAPPGAPEPA